MSAELARPSGPIEFVDVTAQAGIHFKHNSGAFGKKYLPETMGSGVCFIDYDNDGWQDIFLVNSMDWTEHKTGKSFPALYHNNHDGTFTDVTREAGLAIETYGQGCAVGDYDNDGYDDLYLTTVGSNHLFRNLGNGKFADVTAKAGVASPGFSASAVWFDYDNDGKLDLFRHALHRIGPSKKISTARSTTKINRTALRKLTKARALASITTKATEYSTTSQNKPVCLIPKAKR